MTPRSPSPRGATGTTSVAASATTPSFWVRALELSSTSSSSKGPPTDAWVSTQPEVVEVISSMSVDGEMLPHSLAWAKRATFLSLFLCKRSFLRVAATATSDSLFRLFLP
jgi:hypothetical protein